MAGDNQDAEPVRGDSRRRDSRPSSPAIDIDGLLASVGGESLPDAAVRLACSGIPVFPCVAVGKRPLTSHGFHDATTQARLVELWWRRWPKANIGMPTSPASGVDVVDVDLKGAQSGYAAFARAQQAELVDGWLALVRTPSGGMHVYYPAAANRPQPSWQAASAHVDFRGEGGYVIVVPSVGTTASGAHATYTLGGKRRHNPSPVDARALRRLLEPPTDPAAARSSAVGSGPDVDRLAAWVARLGEGERNRGLFWASCRLAEAGVSPGEAELVLAQSARRAGLPAREVASTIRSAYRIAAGTSGRDCPGAATAPSDGRMMVAKRSLG